MSMITDSEHTTNKRLQYKDHDENVNTLQLYHGSTVGRIRRPSKPKLRQRNRRVGLYGVHAPKLRLRSLPHTLQHAGLNAVPTRWKQCAARPTRSWQRLWVVCPQPSIPHTLINISEWFRRLHCCHTYKVHIAHSQEGL